VNGKKYMHLAKTFNVKGGAPVGSIVTITFHTVNWYIDKKKGLQWIRAYEPKFIERRPQQKQPDSAKDVIEIAHKLELLQIKRLEELHLASFKAFMDDKPHAAVMQNHYRGRSVHLDFRIADAKKTYLLGLTVMHERPGRIKDDVDSLKEAKRIEKNWEYYFKMTNKPQTYIASPRRKLWVEWKAPEPIEWLTVEGVVPPGKVGATKREAGVFSIVDRPTVYIGTVKPDFVEFFLYGKRFTGRWVVRLLPNPWIDEMPREKFVWLMWKPENQMPYVLSKRAVEKQWMPPAGISALPPEIRQQIPEEYQYWKAKTPKERREIRDALVEAIRKGKVKIKPVEVVRRVK
ncbi:MAG: hypothetical protein DRJ38_00005, partial [Thermoprotei archaeon]